MASTATIIRRILRSRGISQSGFCPYEAVLPLLPVRSQNRLPSGAQTVIFALFPYYTGEYPHRNISRYAIPDDYHLLAGNLLGDCAKALAERFAGHSFVPFVDSSPIREVEGAYLAGLGYQGKNGMLIHPLFGSYVFIGELVTTLEIPTDGKPMGRCIGCGQCLQRCPGGALREDGMDPARCRSAITQKKGELSDWEARQIAEGGLAWGCDCCNDVCPMNRKALPSDMAVFYQQGTPVITKENLAAVRKRKAFNYRSLAVMQRNLELITQQNFSPNNVSDEGKEIEIP